jgi:hypothetical protein
VVGKLHSLMAQLATSYGVCELRDHSLAEEVHHHLDLSLPLRLSDVRCSPYHMHCCLGSCCLRWCPGTHIIQRPLQHLNHLYTTHTHILSFHLKTPDQLSLGSKLPHTNSTPKMDKPSADCRSSAKRRCLNNRDSDTLFVSKSPEPNVLNAPNARKQDSTVDDISDGDDDVSEFDDPVYDESDEPFPACPAFDPAINDIRVKSQASVKTLDSVLEQYVSVNKDLENMKAKTAEALKPPKSIRRSKRVALVGPTGAGNSVVHIKMFTCTNN